MSLTYCSNAGTRIHGFAVNSFDYQKRYKVIPNDSSKARIDWAFTDLFTFFYPIKSTKSKNVKMKQREMTDVTI